MASEQLQRNNRIQDLPQGARTEDTLGMLQESAKSAFLSGAGGLLRVEERIKTCLNSDAEALSEISRYLLSLGGKRIRPLMALLSERLFGIEVPSERLIDAAAGIELIHMATLLHDDIIDASPTRRSQPSAYFKYGMPQTLLTGDFLLVKAFGLCARLDRFVIEETELACIELTEGEVLEGTLEIGAPLSLDSYLNVISKKTASLFALASVVGAHTAGASAEDIERLRTFGRAAGLAFQIIDDILDVTADEDLLGKPSGTDLKQKTPSLPNVLWLKSGDPKAVKFFSQAEPDTDACRAAIAYLKDSEHIEESRRLAKDYADKARTALAELEHENLNRATAEQLNAIIDYTLERCL